MDEKMKRFEKAKLIDWLNSQISILKRQTESYIFNSRLMCYRPGHDIPIDEGIDYAAGLMGLELRETPRKDEEFPFKYSFVYNGVEFYQISERKLVEL